MHSNYFHSSNVPCDDCFDLEAMFSISRHNIGSARVLHVNGFELMIETRSLSADEHILYYIFVKFVSVIVYHTNRIKTNKMEMCVRVPFLRFKPIIIARFAVHCFV